MVRLEKSRFMGVLPVQPRFRLLLKWVHLFKAQAAVTWLASAGLRVCSASGAPIGQQLSDVVAEGHAEERGTV